MKLIQLLLGIAHSHKEFIIWCGMFKYINEIGIDTLSSWLLVSLAFGYRRFNS